jgi:glycerophosphoryl diester phosphodiesterase
VISARQQAFPVATTISRRGAITYCFAAAANLTGAASDWKLIAHRGCYGQAIAENSAAALEEAIRRRYFMVEVDLRVSEDGKIIVHHDASFRRLFGVDALVRSTRWDRIRRFRTRLGGEHPLLFREFAEIAKGKVGLWLDIKDEDISGNILKQIDETLRSTGALETTIVGINSKATPWFHRRVKTAQSIQTLFYAQKERRPGDRTVLVEGLGFALSDESVQWAHRNGLEAIPFIGAGHYSESEQQSAGTALIERFKKAQVKTFMIDPVFEPLFRQP